MDQTSGAGFAKLSKKFGKGVVLFREGDAGSEMYVVHAGSVELTRKLGVRSTVLARVPVGEFFGEMAILNNRPRSATATVVEDAELLVIDAHTFEQMIRRHSEIAVRLIKAQAARLDRANQQVELLLLKDNNHRVARCLRQLADEYGTKDSGAGVFVAAGLSEIAGRVALEEAEVQAVLERLSSAQLVLNARTAGHAQEGFLIPEVGRLADFLEFLEIRDRFA